MNQKERTKVSLLWDIFHLVILAAILVINTLKLLINVIFLVWSARYRALVDRFTNIIRGQFFGHTHTDQVQVVRSFADGSPVGSIYIAPSFTT